MSTSAGGSMARRRGLPRAPGGEPWPPAIDGADAVAASAATPTRPARAASVATAVSVATSAVSPPGTLRRGLPRVAGGDPWPPAGAAVATPAVEVVVATAPVVEATKEEAVSRAVESPSAAAAFRQGLPRVKGGDPWPPRRPEAVEPVLREAVPERTTAPTAAPAVVTAAPPVLVPAAPTAASPAVAPAPERAPLRASQDDRTPAGASAPRTEPPAPLAPPAPPATKAPASTEAVSRPSRLQALSRPVQVVLGLIALVIVAAVVVLAARGLTTYQPVRDFLATYPGEYELPDSVAPGLPVWLNWSHFLNAFFIVLIIRTGWQVRTEKRPTAFWTNRWSKNPRKISLTLWLHQGLDILWLLNGIVFVVLIFATGHWLRIVPSSWEVFPNALSALLHYLTLEWPVENGWVNYNSLQQLMYFAVIFIAAPLAALTGVRMSGIWPKNAKRLNAIYPVEVARAIHFPVMLFFVFFIIVHVFLVLATGALRNLNHIYGASDDINWIGFGLFVASLAVMAAAWIAARPLVIAPIASLFGKVSSR